MTNKMNRAILQHAFARGEVPAWDCPACGAAALTIADDSFSSTYKNQIDTSHPAFEPEWIDYIFTMTLVCAVPACTCKVVCVGSGGVEWDDLDDGTGTFGWVEYFRPNFFEPRLRVFVPPEGTPLSVDEALNESFAMFFSSPRAALNALRLALEVLLNEMDVPSFTVNGKYMTLDSRIDALDTKYKEIVLPAKAIKLLGNDGSHAGPRITSSHVLDGYDIFEHVLEELYPRTRPSMEALIAKVHADKGVGR